jgi:hypothetical protein
MGWPAVISQKKENKVKKPTNKQKSAKQWQ